MDVDQNYDGDAGSERLGRRTMPPPPPPPSPPPNRQQSVRPRNVNLRVNNKQHEVLPKTQCYNAQFPMDKQHGVTWSDKECTYEGTIPPHLAGATFSDAEVPPRRMPDSKISADPKSNSAPVEEL